MREIKFRAWLPKARKSVWSDYGTVEQRQPDRRKFGRMVEFDPLYFSISDDSLMHPQIFTDTPEHFYGEDIAKSQEGAILMQYTGLKDKNGKEIYEGDIVKTVEGWAAVVSWDDEHTGFDPFGSQERAEWGDGVEVIGNIYENKDLLEAK